MENIRLEHAFQPGAQQERTGRFVSLLAEKCGFLVKKLILAEIYDFSRHRSQIVVLHQHFLVLEKI